MKTKLCLAVVLVLSITCVGYAEKAPPGSATGSAEEWLEEIKNPIPCLKWGFDQRLRTIYQKNPFIFNNDNPANEWHFQRFRSRLWANINPCEDFEIQTRLVWEWRNYCKPDKDDVWERSGPIEWDEALFDRLNFSVKNIFGIEDSKLTVGRQDIILGNGWLVLDGTPQDGSRTIFFDAVRFTHKLDADTTVDLSYIDMHDEADETIEPFNDQEREGSTPGSLTDQDERGAILYVTNGAIIPQAQTSAYLIYKHDMPDGDHPWSNDSDIYALGARVAGAWDESWKYRAEFAQEVGRKNGQDLCAFGFNSRITYLTKDKWDSQFRLGYEYLSGDKEGTDSTNEAFDPLWGRWPQWSELYVYTYATETRIGESTNFHRVGLGHTVVPCPKLKLDTDYHLLFADQNTRGGNGVISEEGCFRGQLLTCKLGYKYNKYVSGHLLAEMFFPGDYYTDFSNDVSVFLRYELMLTF